MTTKGLWKRRKGVSLEEYNRVGEELKAGGTTVDPSQVGFGNQTATQQQQHPAPATPQQHPAPATTQPPATPQQHPAPATTQPPATTGVTWDGFLTKIMQASASGSVTQDQLDRVAAANGVPNVMGLVNQPNVWDAVLMELNIA
jgi:hypothetical protein